MSTWAGTLVETRGRVEFAAIAAKHRIAPGGDVTAWTLVECKTTFANLRPPAFAEALSRELQCAVIAFFVQTTAGVEEVEHWENGKLLRKLQYSQEVGGWITQTGSRQAWEPAYFFDEQEGTAADAKWPSNLDDELTPEELSRYEQARSAKDATTILDLLSGGSIHGIHRVCKELGVSPTAPGARYTPPTNWRPLIIVVAIVLFLIGAVALGALTSPHPHA